MYVSVRLEPSLNQRLQFQEFRLLTKRSLTTTKHQSSSTRNLNSNRSLRRLSRNVSSQTLMLELKLMKRNANTFQKDKRSKLVLSNSSWTTKKISKIFSLIETGLLQKLYNFHLIRTLREKLLSDKFKEVKTLLESMWRVPQNMLSDNAHRPWTTRLSQISSQNKIKMRSWKELLKIVWLALDRKFYHLLLRKLNSKTSKL